MHCDPTSRNVNNDTALHLAVMKGYLDIVRFFISDLNCDPDLPGGQYGRTPLHAAATFGHLNIVKYLTNKQGCNPPRSNDNKYIPLHYDTVNNTALHYAVTSGHLEIVKFLIE